MSAQAFLDCGHAQPLLAGHEPSAAASVQSRIGLTGSAGSPLPAARHWRFSALIRRSVRPRIELDAASPSGTSRRLGLALCLIILQAVCLSAHAQTYAIDWYKVSGGGGTSTGGVYSVSSTIGQPDAGGPMIGGDYALTGGFWSLFALQTPGAPLLTITYLNHQAIVSWPPAVAGWTLQTNNHLVTGTWGSYAGLVVNNRVTNAVSTGNVFFRLVHP